MSTLYLTYSLFDHLALLNGRVDVHRGSVSRGEHGATSVDRHSVAVWRRESARTSAKQHSVGALVHEIVVVVFVQGKS